MTSTSLIHFCLSMVTLEEKLLKVTVATQPPVPNAKDGTLQAILGLGTCQNALLVHKSVIVVKNDGQGQATKVDKTRSCSCSLWTPLAV